MNKLIDVAGLLKAKITKDQLQQALINATSEQNWQTSTHILHQIANFAYNYQKCQQINQFIWDKLKKSKSWKKILKTLNLVQFLLKNGPSSIVSNYKYDIYQFKSLDSYSLHQDGINRGQSIREKAKFIVNLLTNQQLLEEQRLKAKTIRQKMSGIVGGSTYGTINNNSNNFAGNNTGSKYGSIDNKNNKTGTTTYGTNSGYQSGGLGMYGDYNYNKSTLDKYKDNTKNISSSSSTVTQSKLSSNLNTPLNNDLNEEKHQVIQNKKPFQRIAPKLNKPGSKPQIKPSPKGTPTKNTPKKQENNSNSNKKKEETDLFDDILGNQSTPAGQNVNKVELNNTNHLTIDQIPNQQTSFQPVHIQKSNNFKNQNSTQNNLSYSQPQQLPQQQTNLVNLTNSYNTNNLMNLNGLNLHNNTNNINNNMNLNTNMGSPYSMQNMNGINYGFQQQNQGGYNFNLNQGQVNNLHSQNQNLMMNNNFNLYNQPQGQIYGNQFNNNQQQQNSLSGFNLTMTQVQSNNLINQSGQNSNLNILGNVSLSSTTTQKKKQEQQFGNFSSGQTNNIKWLSSQEKGLIDFSDFSQEFNKKQNNNNKNNKMINSSNNNINNNLDMTWNW